MVPARHILVFLALYYVVVTGTKHHFRDGEKVDLWANTVGPFSNPSETYEYYTLPMCPPQVKEKRSQRLGQVLAGDRAVLTDYVLPFKESFSNRKLCDMTFTLEAATLLTKAIQRDYYFEFFYDDLPVFGFVGTSNPDTATYYLFTHWDFTILYNNDQVIHINLTTPGSKAVAIPALPYRPSPSSHTRFPITYSATWIESKIEFIDRRELYQNFHSGFPLRSDFRVQWISIINSIAIVLGLTGFLFVTVMRMLRRDSKGHWTSEEGTDQDLHGWKVVRWDVFRPPPYASLLCGFLGVGTQFLFMAIGTFLLSFFGFFYPTNEGNIYSASIGLYAVTSGIGGYVSAKKYKEFGGKKWVLNICLVAFGIFAVPFACSFAIINAIAHHFKVTAALPIFTILEVFFIWLFVGVPLTAAGGVIGRRKASFLPPVSPKPFPRAVPRLPWYRCTFAHMVIAGFLPFTAIFFELFYIYNCVWGHYYYTFYGILCVIFVILLLVTACVNVTLTYFLLAAEEYRWWWPAFLNGGATGIYVYVFSMCYFAATQMTGRLQGIFYFSYLFICCYCFFILLGTVGFFSSLFFVCYMFRTMSGGYD